MLNIGIQSRGIINENVIEDGYRKIAQSGIMHVDYNILPPEQDNKHSLSYYKKHRISADKYGIKFSQVHAPLIQYEPEQLVYPETLDNILQEMKDSIEICQLLGSPYIVMHLFNRAFEMEKEEERKFNLSFFNQLVEIAVKCNVTICIENVPYRRNNRLYEGTCSNAKDMVDYLVTLNEQAGKECFAACFDVGHANVLGKNLREEVKTLGKYLKVLHIHDNDGITDTHQLPYSFSNGRTGVCTTDWSGFLLGLREIGYKGILSFETYRGVVCIPGVLHDALLKYIYSIGYNFSQIIWFEEKLKQIASKRILFGAGKMFDVYMKEFGTKYPPIFAVDNNKSLWGTTKLGIPICNPDKILDIPEKDRAIILCNAFYEEISEQLREMGVHDYILTEEVLRMNGKPL